FAGAGGFSRGFEQSGVAEYQTTLAIEIDKWAADTFRTNFSEAEVLTADIRNVMENENVQELTTADIGVVIGGPPCQDFSTSNTHSKEQKDPEESLFRYYIDFLKEIEPPAFVIENVPGIQDT
ncbi:MAG: DNA cytosine methyltransferase, partial [Halobacteriaceae archaeon]